MRAFFILQRRTRLWESLMCSAQKTVWMKFSTFYELVKGCAEREFITNGLKRKIPHAHILAMLGELPEPEVAADVQQEVSNDAG